MVDASDKDNIWWPALCGNTSVTDAFWSTDLLLNTTQPDLTDCFQSTVLVWLPCGFLWVASLIYVPYLRGRPRVHRHGQISKCNLLKVVMSAFLVVLSFCDLLDRVSPYIDSSPSTETVLPVDLLRPSLYTVTFILAAVVCHLGFRAAVHSCGVLFCFWLLATLSAAITLRSKVNRAKQQGAFDDLLGFSLFSIHFVLVALQFIVSFFADLEALSPEVKREGGRGMMTERTPLLGADEPAEEGEDGPDLCPRLQATFLSVTFFGWFTPMVIRGYRRTLSFADIWRILPEDSSALIVPRFLHCWSEAMQRRGHTTHILSSVPGAVTGAVSDVVAVSGDGRKHESDDMTAILNGGCPAPDRGHRGQRSGSIPDIGRGSAATADKGPSLLRVLGRTFGRLYLISSGIMIVYDILLFGNPFLLRATIAFVSTPPPSGGGGGDWVGYVLAICMFLVSLFTVLLIQHSFNLLYTAGMRIRTALISAIYRKALLLSSAARQGSSVGEIVNLMAVDAQKIQYSSQFVLFTWSAPLIVVISFYFLWQVLGASCLTGIAFILLVLPANSVILASKIRRLQVKQMALKDMRLKLITQVLSGIKVLKLFAWEPHFQDKVMQIRRQELAMQKKISILMAFTFITWFCAPFMVAMCCFTTYVLTSPTHVLDAEKAFVSMALINLLGFPLIMLPLSIMLTVQSVVSIKRIERFLKLEELDPESVLQDGTVGELSIEDGTFSWSANSEPILRNISMQIHQGSLVAVVGQVGCGKSSLMSAFLGEMHKNRGVVRVSGCIGYVPQQAWIQNMSLRDNILFARPFHERRYQSVVEACALTPDLTVLPAGDMTEIGEKGINLSGGQKQRVSLARAVYQDADVYLLDDPLSAVDAHVGQHIFEKVIGASGMLHGKTRILITHGCSFLPLVDEIIVMRGGEISERGSYQQLLERDGEFANFLRNYLDPPDNDPEKDRLTTAPLSLMSSSDDDQKRSLSPGGRVRHRRRPRTEKKKETKAEERLVEEETMELGAVKLSVLGAYVRDMSWLLVFLTAGGMVGFIVCQVMMNIWLSEWTEDPVVNGTRDAGRRDVRLGVYAGLGLLQAVSVASIAISIQLGGLQAAASLHLHLLANILAAPMAFFDTTPLGRIINRFSKDVDIVDSNIPQFMQNFLLTLAPLVSTLVIILYSTPIFTAAFIPLAIIFIILQRVYVSCARQIKRIDSIVRSPIFAFFAETLNGVGSIRAYGGQPRFVSHSDRLLDDSQSVWFEVFTSNRWVCTWAEMIGGSVVLFACAFAIMQRDHLSPGIIGLSISFALQISTNLTMCVRSSCELETYFVAVERIKDYSSIVTEAAWTIPGVRPALQWPQHGAIEFKKYSTRYRPGLDLVLKEISCHIRAGEKIGIVGRTGAGKSSFTLALFRVLEAASGSIEVDGQDIAHLGLHDVRRKLTIIPQDPVLFSGSLRFNMDPAGDFSDDEVWRAVDEAHLRQFVSGLPNDLYFECGEDGLNLSVGQRQLVCLARAMLKRTRILVLDEATAAIDLETDDLIQSTIRVTFRECTVLTVAHRLNTVIDYDRIMVLQGGQLKEFDTPSRLLDDTQSIFYAMARDSGLVSLPVSVPPS